MVNLSLLSTQRRNQAILALAATVMPLWILQRLSPLTRYYVRCITYLGGLGFTAGWGVVASAFMALIGQRENSNWVVARSFYYLIGPILGLKFRVEGIENLPKPGEVAIIVGNHQSMVDIMYLGAFFPKACSIMAKKELKYTPFLGQFMSLSNAVFVDRADRQSAVSQFAKVGEIMKNKGVSLFVFAEGTRTSYEQPTLLPFKKGAFHLAVQGQFPIIPVVCENYWKVYSSSAKRFESGEIVIRVLPPISSTGFTSSSDDISRFANLTRDHMLDALGELAKRPDTCSGSTLVERDGQIVYDATKGARKAKHS